MIENEIREMLINNLNRMSSFDVSEYTLFRKWEELNEKRWSLKELNEIYYIKKSIWIPQEPKDYLKLKPVVILADDVRKSFTWSILRAFTSTMHWNISPGRLLRFYVIDSVTNTYLGVISIASDFLALGGRDAYIGWPRDLRINGHMINHTAMGSSIVPTQPLGYNYVGGKLMALLTLSDVIQNIWNKRYEDILVGITTTSLYGGLSQYNRLKYWHKCDSTEGKISIEPSNEVYLKVRDWIKEKYPVEFAELQKKKISTSGKFQPQSHPKARILSVAYNKLKVKAIENNFSRGVYFANLYDNTREFLCKKTDVLGNKLFDNSVDALTDLWKERYVVNRLRNVMEKKTYNTDILFYDDVIGKSWEEIREKYLGEVGR